MLFVYTCNTAARPQPILSLVPARWWVDGFLQSLQEIWSTGAMEANNVNTEANSLCLITGMIRNLGTRAAVRANDGVNLGDPVALPNYELIYTSLAHTQGQTSRIRSCIQGPLDHCDRDGRYSALTLEQGTQRKARGFSR